MVRTVSTTSLIVCALLLTAAFAVALPLARSAAFRWTTERAGRAYELPEDYRPAAVRATASATVLVTGVVLAVTLSGVTGTSRPGVGRTPVPLAAAAPPAAPSHRHPATLRPTRPTPMPAADPQPRTLGLPVGGVLWQLADGTRVWVPPQYGRPRAAHLAFPLVVAYLPLVAADREELYPALVRQVARGRADPFVVVQPRDCSADTAAALAEVSRHYRVLPGRSARAVLGVGASAPCAVREALAHPDRFGAAVGVSGRYDPVRVPRTVPGPAPRVMLVAAAGEGTRRESARRLRTGLRGAGARVRMVDGVVADPRIGGGRRRHELAVSAEYLTEELAGPGRTTGR